MEQQASESPGGRPRPVTLDPMVQRLVEDLAISTPLHDVPYEHARRLLIDLQDDEVAGDGVDAAFHVAPVGPNGLVGFWLVKARGNDVDPGPQPAVLYLHGGRWMLGDGGTHGRLVREIARRAGSAVIVPEYTRAPEARHPVALEETYALLLWVTDHALSLGLRRDRFAVAGDCAGATLAIGVTLLSRQRGGPRLRAQLLYCPWTDPAATSISYTEFAESPVLGRVAARWYWSQYCDETAHDEPTVAPLTLAASDLTGLPPAMIVTAEADVLRDEAETYGQRLRQAGVPVVVLRYLGVTHDFVSLRPLATMPAALVALREGVAFLAETLHPVSARREDRPERAS